MTKHTERIKAHEVLRPKHGQEICTNNNNIARISVSENGTNMLIIELDREYSSSEKASILAQVQEMGYFQGYEIQFEVVEDYHDRWEI